MYAPKGDNGAGESKEGFCCTARPLTSYTPPTVTRGPENVPPRGQTAILPFLFTIQMGQEGSRSNIGAMVSTYKIETRKGVLSLSLQDHLDFRRTVQGLHATLKPTNTRELTFRSSTDTFTNVSPRVSTTLSTTPAM